MADIHTMPGAAPPPAPEAAPPLTAIEGWDVDHFGDLPPVIANSQAGAEALLAWGLGQLSQLNVLLRAASHDGTPDLADAVRHFTEQVQQAMVAAQDRLD
ncbi:MAG: hypothetical protein QM750_00190 [Rubrivivax sp.]